MIGVIVAMEKEARNIVDGLSNVKHRVYLGKDFYEGERQGKPVVLALSGIGKVNAAYTATLMAVEYAPEFIINTGIAGGLGRLPSASVMIVKSAVQYDSDTTAFGDPIGNVNVNGVNKVYLDTDSELSEILLKSAKGATYGIVATGDRFVADTAFGQMLKETFDASACDMECGAIAEVTELSGIKFGAIKVISDSADDSAGEDYASFALRACEINANTVLTALDAM